MSRIYSYQEGYKTCYVPQERPVLAQSQGSAKDEMRGITEASCNYWPSPREIMDHITLLVGTYLIDTMFRAF